MRYFKFLFTLSIFLLAISCTQPAVDTGNEGGGLGGGSGDGSKDPGGSLNITVDEKYLTCDTSKDCTAVELGCCDICNGGRGVSVNKTFKDEVYQKYKSSCSVNFICTAKACFPSVPATYCKDKKCTFITSADENLFHKCQKNEDCILMNGKCCNSCNGGNPLAINKDYVDVYESVPANCSGIICPDKEPCLPIEATCQTNLCSITPKIE